MVISGEASVEFLALGVSEGHCLRRSRYAVPDVLDNLDSLGNIEFKNVIEGFTRPHIEVRILHHERECKQA